MLERETAEVRRQIEASAKRLRLLLPKLPAQHLANLLENEVANPANSIAAEMPIRLIIEEAVKRLRAR